MGNSTFEAAAQEMRQQIEEKIATIKGDPVMMEILRLHEALNGLEKLMNQPQTSLVELLGLREDVSATRLGVGAAAEWGWQD